MSTKTLSALMDLLARPTTAAALLRPALASSSIFSRELAERVQRLLLRLAPAGKSPQILRKNRIDTGACSSARMRALFNTSSSTVMVRFATNPV